MTMRHSLQEDLGAIKNPINQKQYESLRLSHREHHRESLFDEKRPLVHFEDSNHTHRKPIRHTSNDSVGSKTPKNTVYQQKEGKIKDELEYATNWRRAYHQLFTRLKWLNAYA